MKKIFLKWVVDNIVYLLVIVWVGGFNEICYGNDCFVN